MSAHQTSQHFAVWKQCEGEVFVLWEARFLFYVLQGQMMRTFHYIDVILIPLHEAADCKPIRLVFSDLQLSGAEFRWMTFALSLADSGTQFPALHTDTLVFSGWHILLRS
jgi:hypothetical protein